MDIHVHNMGTDIICTRVTTIMSEYVGKNIFTCYGIYIEDHQPLQYLIVICI